MDEIKNKSPFLEEVRKVLRVQHYAIRSHKDSHAYKSIEQCPKSASQQCYPAPEVK
jgi:hypothetical protein